MSYSRNYDRIRVTTTITPGLLKQLDKAALTALEQTADALKTEVMSAAVIPKDTSATEISGHVDSTNIRQGKARLSYDTPYARKIYWHPEINFRTDKNANAKGMWLEDWVTGSKKDFAYNAYRKLYRRLIGRVLQ